MPFFSQIFDSNDYSFIALIPSPYKQALTGGDFVAANRVLIWDKVSYDIPFFTDSWKSICCKCGIKGHLHISPSFPHTFFTAFMWLQFSLKLAIKDWLLIRSNNTQFTKTARMKNVTANQLLTFKWCSSQSELIKALEPCEMVNNFFFKYIRFIVGFYL